MNLDPFFKISYGLYIVTGQYGHLKGGYIANTVFQVTSNPPQFAISCSKDNYTTSLIKQSGVFAFSVLAEKSSPSLIGKFGYQSGREVDKFDGVTTFTGKTGVPIVTDSCAAWFECRVTQTMDVGTHLLFIGEVVDKGMIDDKINALTYNYYREVLKGYSPKNAPTYIEKTVSDVLLTGKAPEGNADVWLCQLCHYEYDESKGDPISGIAAGTSFLELPDDWVCPICGADKTLFEKEKF